MVVRRSPGSVRDAILKVMDAKGEVSITEIRQGVAAQLGDGVPSSSVRSYLRLNEGTIFERVGYGRYKLKKKR